MKFGVNSKSHLEVPCNEAKMKLSFLRLLLTAPFFILSERPFSYICTPVPAYRFVAYSGALGVSTTRAKLQHAAAFSERDMVRLLLTVGMNFGLKDARLRMLVLYSLGDIERMSSCHHNHSAI